MKNIESAILCLHTTKPSNSIWDLPPPQTTQVPEPKPTEPTSDPTPYRTALLSVPTTPTESSAVDYQVIEERPALPEVSFAISSLFSVSSAYVSISTSAPGSNPAPAPVCNPPAPVSIPPPPVSNPTAAVSNPSPVANPAPVAHHSAPVSNPTVPVTNPPPAPNPTSAHIYFKGAGHILSNFYPCVMTYTGLTFHSSEHLYQYRKAVEHSDYYLATLIRAAPPAKDSKVLSKQVNTSRNWFLMKQGIHA